MGDAERIGAVADHVARTRERGDEVVVVVSAMGKFTDDLIRLADDVSPDRPPRELDMLLTAGERISMALVSMALGARGVESASFTGSQAGIITNTDHTRAKILEMHPDADTRGPGRGAGARGRRIPGGLDREGHHHARPWRIGRHRRRARRPR